jgi:hypothetical protein
MRIDALRGEICCLITESQGEHEKSSREAKARGDPRTVVESFMRGFYPIVMATTSRLIATESVSESQMTAIFTGRRQHSERIPAAVQFARILFDGHVIARPIHEIILINQVQTQSILQGLLNKMKYTPIRSAAIQRSVCHLVERIFGLVLDITFSASSGNHYVLVNEAIRSERPWRTSSGAVRIIRKPVYCEEDG